MSIDRCRWAGRVLLAMLLAMTGLVGAAGPAGAAEDPVADPEPVATEEVADDAPPTSDETAGPDGPSTRIVGGTEAPPGAWPSQVALLFADTPSNFHAQFCGGTLVERSWVLTAGHCVKDDGWHLNPSDIHVLVGTQDLNSGGTRMAVDGIVTHPAWTPSTENTDVALVHLANPAPASIPIQTLTAQGVSPPAGTEVVTTGWGTTAYGSSSFPTKLRQVTVDVSTSAACQSAYPTIHDAAAMICAARAGRDACQGDSGGPLVEDRSGTWVQVGIVSYGYGCAFPGYPGIYARVSHVTSWVRSHTRLGPHATPQALVRSTYLDAFGRQPTTLEMFYGVAALNDGTSPQAFVRSIVTSPRYDDTTGGVTRLFQAVFLRRPDSGGLAYWWGQVNGPRSLARIAQIMVASGEFQTRYGSLGNTAFVNLVYQNVLGRNAFPAETTYWVGELSSGRRNRGQVMVGFSQSPEYKALTRARVDVVGAYFLMLRRSPATAELDYWDDQPLASLVSALYASRDYALLS